MPACFPVAFLRRFRDALRRHNRSEEVVDVKDGVFGSRIVEIIEDTGRLSVRTSLLLAISVPLPPSAPPSTLSVYSHSSRSYSSTSFSESTASSPVLSPSPLSHDPEGPSDEVPVTLPLELWAEVFGYVDESTLKALMVVNRMFSDEAERYLYRNVFLQTGISLANFAQSLSTSPHRASLVISVHIPYVEDQGSLVTIPNLLRTLRKLQHLTLKLFETRLPQDYVFILQMIHSIPFPSLRSLSVRVPLSLDVGFLQFLQTHPHLKHLDLGEIPPSAQTDYSTFQFPTISSLACTFRLLSSLCPLPNSLTHLHVLSCSSSQLVRVSELLGPQIVSLRLGSIYVPAQNVTHEHVPMSLHDVATHFPRLRFLQLDMGQEDKRYRRVQAVDYRIKRAASLPSPEPNRSRITLVWIFSRPKNEGNGMYIEAGYQQFMNRAASKVLREWSYYVERVVSSHTTGTYESVAFDEDGVGLVRTVDRDMWEGYWRCV